MECYEVFYENKPVGTVTAEKQGLYYLLTCRCRSLDGMLRLMLRGSAGTVPIGICSPAGKGIGIRRKIATKQLGHMPWEFFLSSGEKEEFIPLGETLPTEILENLPRARFCRRDNVPGLLLPYLSEE